MDVISLIDGQISIAIGVIQCTLCSELCLLIVLPPCVCVFFYAVQLLPANSVEMISLFLE